MKPEYKTVLNAYFNNIPKSKKTTAQEHQIDSVRRIVRDGLAEVRPWDEMSPTEQDFFVYVTIRERVLKYVEKAFGKKMRTQIEKQTKGKCDESISIAQEMESMIEENIPFMFRRFDTSTMTDKEARAAYKEFYCCLTNKKQALPHPRLRYMEKRQSR